MYTEKVSISKKRNLYLTLDKQTRSLQKRGVSIVVQASSGTSGSIDIQVNGVKGIARKVVTVYFDTGYMEWIAVSNDIAYHMDTLENISTIARSIISKLYTIVSKL